MSPLSNPVTIKPWVLTPEEEKKLGEADATAAWLYQLASELRRQYAGKYIAAKNCQFLAASADYGDLLHQIADHDPAGIVIQWIERPGKVVY